MEVQLLNCSKVPHYNFPFHTHIHNCFDSICFFRTVKMCVCFRVGTLFQTFQMDWSFLDHFLGRTQNCPQVKFQTVNELLVSLFTVFCSLKNNVLLKARWAEPLPPSFDLMFCPWQHCHNEDGSGICLDLNEKTLLLKHNWQKRQRLFYYFGVFLFFFRRKQSEEFVIQQFSKTVAYTKVFIRHNFQ